MPVVQESVKFDRTIGELRQNLVYIYPCVFDDGFFRLRNGWCQDDMLRNGRVKAAELRDQQRSLGNHPGGDFSKTLIMVGVKLLEYLDEASRAGVVNAPAFRFPFNFVDAAFGVERVDYFTAVRVHHHQFARLINVAALHTTADKQAAIGSVQRDCMRLGPSGDWPRGDRRAFFAVDHNYLASVSHNDIQFRRGRIKHETGGIFAFDVNAGDKRTVVYIHDFDGSFGTGVGSRVRAVTQVKETSACIVDAVVRDFSGILAEVVPRERNVFDQFVGISTEGLQCGVAIVYPDLVGFRQINCLARIASEAGDRVNHFAFAKIDDLDGPLMFAGNKQALAFQVHGHVVEVALDVRQRDGLYQFHRRTGLRPRWR